MLKLLLGDPNTRKLKRYQPIVEEINFLEDEISQLTDDELRKDCLLYTSPSPRDKRQSRMPSSA